MLGSLELRVQAAMRNWRVHLEWSEASYSLPQRVCDHGQCTFVLIDPRILLYGCKACKRTHICEATQVTATTSAGDGDHCVLTVNAEQYYMCVKSGLVGVHDAVVSRYGSYNEFQRLSHDRFDEEDQVPRLTARPPN
jgi:hypothetical protein